LVIVTTTVDVCSTVPLSDSVKFTLNVSSGSTT
jgi:hypothetical protein